MTLHTVELLNIGGIAAYSTLRGAADAMNPYDGFSIGSGDIRDFGTVCSHFPF